MVYKLKTFGYRGNVPKLLENAGYDWRATGTFGVELLRANGFKTDIYLVYVKSDDLSGWERYLKSKRALPIRVIPNIKFIGVETLPASSKRNVHIVSLDKLISDLETMAPRFSETNGKLMRYLRRISA